MLVGGGGAGEWTFLFFFFLSFPPPRPPLPGDAPKMLEKFVTFDFPAIISLYLNCISLRQIDRVQGREKKKVWQNNDLRGRLLWFTDA